MSQSKSTEAGDEPKYAHYRKACALVLGEFLFGGRDLGLKTKINTTIQVHRETDRTSWMGFAIEIPFGEKNEEEGFGVCHTCKGPLLLVIVSSH